MITNDLYESIREIIKDCKTPMILPTGFTREADGVWQLSPPTEVERTTLVIKMLKKRPITGGTCFVINFETMELKIQESSND
jgi:hypothetical protein